MNKTVICPGSFDPVTLGHLDVITRASKLFDRVIVGVLVNSSKKPIFSIDERIELLKEVTEHLNNVEIVGFNGLLAQYCEEHGVDAIVKGLRAVTDFEYEFQIALMNRKLRPDIETLFLISDYRWLYISSTIVKTVASLGGDVRGLVPDHVLSCLRERFGFTHGEIEPVSLPPVPELSELARLQELEASLDRDTDK